MTERYGIFVKGECADDDYFQEHNSIEEATLAAHKVLEASKEMFQDIAYIHVVKIELTLEA